MTDNVYRIALYTALACAVVAGVIGGLLLAAAGERRFKRRHGSRDRYDAWPWE